MRVGVVLAAAALVAALAGCVGPSNELPAGADMANAVSVSPEQNGRFVSIAGPRRQQAEPFLGVPGTNYFLLRSQIDTRSGQTSHQLYVEDSYFGAERKWDAARDAQGQPLKFIPISQNEISCSEHCSYAEEFAVDLPEPSLRSSTGGLTVVVSAGAGANKTIAIPGQLIAEQLAAVDAARTKLPVASAVPAR
jgi:hypothetical protein